MDKVDDLEAFLAVVEAGGLSAAARRLRRSLQSVSRSLATLESGIGTELIRRTTRRSVPTETGLAFYRRIKPAVAEIAEARLEASTRNAEPSGLLRIGASALFATPHLLPVLAKFMEQHPRIEVELNLADRFVNLIDEGLDLVVRIGELPDSGLKARRLGELRRVTFGAPSYFARHGKPDHPAELTRHQCVVRSGNGTHETWSFLVQGQLKNVSVTGRFRANSRAATCEAVALGLGIGFAPLWQIRGLVDQGALDLILTEFEPPKVPINLVWHASKIPSARMRLFTDFLAAQARWDRL